MITITISGPVEVTDDATDDPVTDPKRLREFDGLSSGRETCAKYHHGPVEDLDLKGGAVTLVFDASKKKLRVVSEFTSARKLTAKELALLVDDTRGQWSDGIGEGCFDRVMDKKKVVIDLTPYGGKATATQTDDGKPAPKPKAVGELWKAVAAGDLEQVKALVAGKAKLDTRGKNGHTPLTEAISGDKTEIALSLIEHGANPNATDKHRCPPLRWAAIRSGWVMRHQNVKVAEALLDRGAVLDERDKDGFTPLIWAANRAAAKLVKLLIDRGADVNARTTQKYNEGRTALMLAKDAATIRVLLDAGADPKAVDKHGQHTWDGQSAAVAKILKEAAGVK
jgi:hypothetical protein